MPVTYISSAGGFKIADDIGREVRLTLPEAHEVAQSILDVIEGVDERDKSWMQSLHEVADKAAEKHPEERDRLHAAATKMGLEWRLRRMIRRFVTLRQSVDLKVAEARFTQTRRIADWLGEPSQVDEQDMTP